jgi:serine/threonine protein phosphatase PrpC
VIDALHPVNAAPFSVEAFSCQKAGNARSEYEDAWAIRGSDSPTRCRIAVADGATESSFSALWAALLVESFVRGRAHGPEFFNHLGAIRRLWRRKIRGRPLPWYAAEKARRGAYAAFVGASLNAVNRGWRAVAIGDCCLLHVTGTPAKRELTKAFPLSQSEEFGSSPFLVGSKQKADDDPLPHVRVSEGVLGPNDILFFASDALAAWLLRRTERGEPAWDALESLRTQEEFETLVAQAREDGTRNDDMTLVRLSRQDGREKGTG